MAPSIIADVLLAHEEFVEKKEVKPTEGLHSEFDIASETTREIQKPALHAEMEGFEVTEDARSVNDVSGEVREFIYRSKLPDIDIPNHMPLADYCLERAAEWSDKACLIDGVTGQVHTYGEVELGTRRVAAGLSKMGVEKGGVVALLLPNCAEFVLVFLGAAKRGAVVTTANPFYTAMELEKQITASGATVVVTQSSYVEKLDGLSVQVAFLIR
jgi:hypothetical protein